MKKWIVWFLMIPICAIALSCCYEYIMSAPLKMNIEPTGLLIFIPIFYVLCVGNVLIHFWALITGITQSDNTNFLRFNSFTKKGILKWIGVIFIICYSYDLFVGFRTNNLYSIIWNILAIVVTLFYVSWFNTYNFNIEFIKNKLHLS